MGLLFYLTFCLSFVCNSLLAHWCYRVLRLEPRHYRCWSIKAVRYHAVSGIYFDLTRLFVVEYAFYHRNCSFQYFLFGAFGILNCIVIPIHYAEGLVCKLTVLLFEMVEALFHSMYLYLLEYCTHLILYYIIIFPLFWFYVMTLVYFAVWTSN